MDCADCQQCPPPFIAAATPLRYTFPIDAAIKAMKFRRRLYYVPAFSPMLMKTMACLPKDVDALLAVPLHWRRHATRGFNQAVELCKPLQKLTGLPML
ncbi:MAG: ComF family protein, partial [Proteobacteria bacterium]|nr:ComF family protein [Pseudomonadota bacterium]